MRLKYFFLLLSAIFIVSCCAVPQESQESKSKNLEVEILSSTSFKNGESSRFELSKIKIEGHTYFLLTDYTNKSTSLLHDIKCIKCTPSTY